MISRPKRIALWLAGAMMIGLVLLLALNSLLTRIITSESFQKKLIEQVCAPLGCRLTFERLELALLPSPQLTASGVQVALPGRLSGTVDRIAVVPSLLPLVTGRLAPAAVRLEAPRIEITIPELAATISPPEAPSAEPATNSPQPDSPSRHRPLSVPDAAPGSQPPAGDRQDSSSTIQEALPWLSRVELEARFLEQVGALSEKVPGLRLQVAHGSLDVIQNGRHPVSLRDLSALLSLPPGILSLKLECRSNLWGKLAVESRLDPVESKSTGHLSLDHFQLQSIGQYLPAGTLKPVGDSPVDLDITFSSLKSGLLEATFQASIPSLVLEVGGSRATMSDTAFSGSLQVEPGRMDFRVDRLQAADPQLDLSGRFRSDSEAAEAFYRLECRNTNATALREAALALLGDREVVQDVFTFVRGGRVPLATFEARSPSVADLAQAGNLVVRGRLEDGEVHIPKIGLKIGEVYGDVVIADGILEGTNLLGKTGRSVGRRGSLTVALMKKDGPFHLEIEIDAELAELPPVLARVVDNQAFLRELALVRDVAGSTKGRLILGDTLDAIETRVETGEWKLQGVYERVPFPLSLEGRGLVYEGRGLAVEALSARFGGSQVNELTGSLTWEREPSLELTAPARGRLVLDELFPWLLTFSPVRNNRWQIERLEGTLRMDSLTFAGPLTQPDGRHFALTGLLQKVTATSRFLGNPVKINSGALSCTPRRLDVSNWDLGLFDASLAVSGKLTGFLTEQPSADFTFQGTVGSQAAAWLADAVALPAEFRVRAPLALLPSRFTLDPSGRGTFAGAFRTGDGTDLTVDLERGDEELVLKQLKVVDQESNAVITANRKPTAIAFGFQGKLAGATLDRLLLSNSFFKGSMTGNFSVRLDKDRLADSGADGTLALTDFRYPALPGTTLRVEEAAIEAREHTIEFKSAALRLQDMPLKLSGTITAGQNQLLLDLDLKAQGIDWSSLQAGDFFQKLGDSALGGETADGITFLGIPIRGVLRLQADQFAYAGFGWKPFKAALAFASDGLAIEVTQANLCAMPTPARLVPHPQGSVLIVTPAARNLDLDTTLGCLFGRRGNITGSVDLHGEITAAVRNDNPLETLRGKVRLKARDGRVYHSPVLSKIFTLLNVTEIYRGQLPDLMHEGCAYDSINARANLKHGKVLIEDAVFDGQCAKMVWTGEIDLRTLKVEFTVLVSPFKTVDTVIRHIPLLGDLLGGTLVTIPLQVSGAIGDPGVTPLAPTAVASGLLNTMKKVFQLPFTLQQPLP